jgi:formylglycine-generating enzyme required for sulfatase activity
VKVNWNDAVGYAAWLSEKTGRAFRLPSEAEWQYAARAGTTGNFYWGDGPATDHANVGDDWAKPSARGKDRWVGYAPVGQFAANPWGVHDMAGNVWEWVQDCYHGDFVGAPADGSAWMAGDCSRHVQVGNSFHNLATPVYERGGQPADKGNATVGFRLAEDR